MESISMDHSRVFSHPVIGFLDPDGLRLEIATLEGAGEASISAGDRRAPDSILGFDGVTLCVEAPERTIKLLTETFGYRQVMDESGRIRFNAVGAGDGAIGTSIDVLFHPEAMRSRLGGATVHHVAFRARTDDEQKIWREQIVSLGFNVTPILDRQYFRSIYFREPGGVLFEIATDSPGFAVDEEPDRLGTALKLPPWLEPSRASIERRLPPVRLPNVGS
jgi:glyoxalase family protein